MPNLFAQQLANHAAGIVESENTGARAARHTRTARDSETEFQEMLRHIEPGDFLVVQPWGWEIWREWSDGGRRIQQRVWPPFDFYDVRFDIWVKRRDSHDAAEGTEGEADQGIADRGADSPLAQEAA